MLNLAPNLFSFIGFTTADSNLFPLVLAALLVDAGIVAIWYFLGALLNNGMVRAGAKAEFSQFLGSIIITGIIIVGLFIFGSTMYNALNATTLMSSTAMTTMCQNIMQYNTPQTASLSPHSLSIISSTDSLLAGSSTANTATSTNQATFPGLCNMLAPTSIDGYIDYPLVASSVILANLTNQTISNMDAFYDVTTFLTWQSNVKPTIALNGAASVLKGALRVQVGLTFDFQPYAGFAGSLGRTYRALGNLLTNEFIALVGQLLIYSAFLYIWPFLLFAGLIMRSIIFTRKIGGLLIAIAIGGLIFLPLIYSIEYLSLANGVPNYTSLQSEYGFNSISPIPSRAGSISPPYQLNFFIMPSVQGIATYAKCPTSILWAATNASSWHPDFLAYELTDIAALHTPIGSLSYVTGSLLKQMGVTPNDYEPSYLVVYCGSKSVLTFVYQSYNLYGIDTVVAWMLPLLNLGIVFAGVRAVSGLMGGDTSLAGLSKLV
jgi:hypothetical protein